MQDRHRALRDLWFATRGRPKLRRLVREAIGECSVTYQGLRLELTPSDNHTEFMLWLNGAAPEDEATAALRDRFRGQRVTVVDVGANAGIFSLPIHASAGDGSRAICIEPNPDMRSRLMRNVANNDLSAVDVVPCAVSDREGDAELFLPPNGNLGQARLGVQYAGPQAAHVVRVKTLAAVLDELNVAVVDLLKVDVEGLEDRVIAPYLDAVEPRRLPRLIYFEDAHSQNWKIDLVSVLRAKGYSETERFGPNALYALPALARAPQVV